MAIKNPIKNNDNMLKKNPQDVPLLLAITEYF